ncbi:MAG TPA: Hpt domain-containing protein [Nitrospira sp.]|nr:Hpt domain-containing protein [Nitrospira sp.]
MTAEFDRDNLISIFVLEASDAMAVVMKALSPSDTGVPSPEQLVGQYIVAHRVRGAAALYGYAGISRLAERLETLLEHASDTPPTDWPGRVASMCDLTRHIQLIVQSIGQGGSEDVDLVERCLASAPNPVLGSSDVSESELSTSSVTHEYIVPAIDSEILSYFLPEAEEHLTTIAQLISEIRCQVDDDLLYRLFRAIHTLKGSAYTVGYQVIGDLALPMEDCMIAIREQRRTFQPDIVDVLEQGMTMIRLVLGRDPMTVQQLQHDVPPCLERLVLLCAKEAPVPSISEASPVFSGATNVKHDAPGPDTPVVHTEITVSDHYLIPALDADVLAYFLPEAHEYLDTLETNLLQLDGSPPHTELIHQLFRTAHTLKGSAYTVGFQSIGDLVHHVEDVMEGIRDGRLRVLPGLTDLMLRSVDVVRLLTQRDWSRLGETRKRFQAVRVEFEGLRRTASVTVAPLQSRLQPPVVEGSRERADEDQRPEKREDEESERNREVIRVSSDRLERLMNLVGELVIGRGRLEQRLHLLEQLSKQVLSCKARLTESVQSFSDKHTFTYREVPAGPVEPVRHGLLGDGDFGTLELDKYDDFNILARHISEVSADISESMAQLHSSIHRAHDEMSQLQQMMLAMRDEIAHARMVPIGTPFTRFRRAIREMARASNKDVTLVTSGEQTEVDTGVVERLVDPLVHLVRNAVHHGIESAAERRDKGKPQVGTIHLHAAHRGNSMIIEVEDDGAGLDLAKIRAKAVKMGLVDSSQVATMPDAEILQSIFCPGFSTAETIGDQAGRGVGLDVVKRVIEGMNGHIAVESELGAGTKFTLSLPITLLIATALIVRSGAERYAIPLLNIQEVTIPTPSSWRVENQRARLQVGDQIIEVQLLHYLLRRERGMVTGAMPVVVVRAAGGLIGLAVDELLGRQEVVIKSLGKLKLLTQSCFGGATIDPEGRVILVVDPTRLIGRDSQEMAVQAVLSKAQVRSEPVVPDQERVPGHQGVRLLLVDDSLSIRKFVGKMLESAGYQVDTAVDGEDGLRKASTFAYSMILTDLEMPKLNGFEVIQALRRGAETRETPVVVMTTRAGDKHRQKAINIGANSYIAKPVEERMLLQEVERWVGRPRTPST